MSHLTPEVVALLRDAFRCNLDSIVFEMARKYDLDTRRFCSEEWCGCQWVQDPTQLRVGQPVRVLCPMDPVMKVSDGIISAIHPASAGPFYDVRFEQEGKVYRRGGFLRDDLEPLPPQLTTERSHP